MKGKKIKRFWNIMMLIIVVLSFFVNLMFFNYSLEQKRQNEALEELFLFSINMANFCATELGVSYEALSEMYIRNKLDEMYQPKNHTITFNATVNEKSIEQNITWSVFCCNDNFDRVSCLNYSYVLHKGGCK